MIHNFVVDYNKSTKIHNIEFSNPESIYSITLGGSKKGIFSGDFSASENKHPINNSGIAQKINFYNPMIPEPLHKFWYYISTAKLLRKDKGMMIITLSSTDINLIESLKNLDAKTDEILKKIGGNNIIPTIKISDTFPPIIEIHVDSSSKCYNQENKLCTYMEIMNGAKIQLYIEFDCVMIEANKCERKWRVMQMKEHKPIDLNTNMFDSIPLIQTPQIQYNMMGLNQQIPQIPQMMSNPYAMAQGQTPSYSMPGIMPGMSGMMPGMSGMMPGMMPGMPYNPQYSQQIPGNIRDSEQQYPIRPSALDILSRSQGLRSITGSDDLNTRSLPIPQINKENKEVKEDKPSGPIGGSVFRPPTAGDLMSMLGKLKKPTKKDDEIEEKHSEPPKKEEKQLEPPKKEEKHSEPPKKEEKYSEPPKMEIVNSNIIVDEHKPDEHKPDEKKDNEYINENMNKNKNKNLDKNIFLNQIKDLIKKNTEILDLHIIDLNNDIQIAKNIFNQIEKIIQSRKKLDQPDSCTKSEIESDDSGFEI
jgi:hypothetical protein